MQSLDPYRSIGDPTDEIFIQQEIARNCKYGIVEIGVLFGETTKRFCESAPPGVEVYAIDPFIPDSMNINLIGNEHLVANKLSKFDNFNLFVDYSYNVVNNFSYKYDYLFIDGSHNYNDVKQDLEDWLPGLQKGGYVSLHDSAMDRGGANYWPDPSRLARELFSDSRVEHITTIYSLTIFVKK